MAQVELIRFLMLAAIWGSSYMFMRIAAPGFGPLPLVMLRLAGAALFFLPWLLRAPVRPLLRRNVPALFLLAALNSAIPFSLLAFSVLRLQAGFCAILGATVPMFAVAIDALWWRHALQPARLAGLALGFGGVTILAWDHLDFSAGGTGWSVLATLGASACYGCAAHYGKHRFANQPVMLPAAGSMLAAALLLLPLGLWEWPAQTPPLLDDALPEFERTLIRVALTHTRGHRQEAAKLLGWGRNTLTRKLRELGMNEGETDGES